MTPGGEQESQEVLTMLKMQMLPAATVSVAPKYADAAAASLIVAAALES